MPFRNVVDDTSESVSASTPGWTVDLRNHTTHRLRNQGVPVRFKVCVNSTAGNDTGAIKLVDENGSAVLTCLINNPAATTSPIGDWYWADGYVPATLAKYDVHYGGNTLGTLTPLSASLYEIDWTTDPVTGSMSATLGAMTAAATATVEWQANASLTLDALTVASAGTVDVIGTVSQTLGAVTVASAGTVATAAAPTYQAIGTQVGDFGALTPAWPTHATDDVAILVVGSFKNGSDPGAATLSADAGFTAVTGGSDLTVDGSTNIRITTFWCRATSGAMGSPTVADSHDTADAVIITFRGCTTSGTPTDGASTASNASTNTSFTVPGVVTTGTNRAVLVIGAQANSATMSGQANANLTSLTERNDATVFSVGLTLVTGIAAASGNYGSTTGAYSTDAAWAGVTVALKP